MLDAKALSQLTQLKTDIQSSKDYAEGEVASTGGRFGFVRTDDGRDAYLAPEKMERVLAGDRVKVSIVENNQGKLEATLEKLLGSEISKFVGQYRVKGKAHFVVPQGGKFTRWIFVPPKYRKNAQDGEFVVAKISRHPFNDGKAQSNVLFRIGTPQDPYIEHKYIKAKYNLNYRIDEAAKAQIEKIENSDLVGEAAREDLSDSLFFTIDSPSTLDMDDALSIKKTDNGYALNVAIADPASFIAGDSPLAKQALEASQSVYLLGGAVPMLPSNLAHHTFSLEEGKSKPALVCTIDIADDGEITQFRFIKSIIKSQHKLNYDQVAHALGDVSDNAQAENKHAPIPENVLSALIALREMSELRRQYRSKHHLVFNDQDDYEHRLDAQGKISEIALRPRNIAHQIVEESMLATNICAGQFLKQHNTGLHSVHLGFRPERIGEVNALLKEEALSSEDLDDLAGYLDLIKTIQNDESRAYLHHSLRRMMRAAEVSNTPNPHFGLGLANYATITSPIRRFVDLYNHWCMNNILKNQNTSVCEQSITDKINERISNGRQADRELQQWLICLFSKNIVGQKFRGSIRIVTQQGFGVKIAENGIEGFVLFDKKAEKTFDAKRMTLEVDNTIYKMGDEVNIAVKSVDLDKRRIAFELCEEPSA